MTISVGERIPNNTLYHMTGDGPAAITTDELLGGKKVVLFGLPGAFTPTCSAQHVPSFLNNADALRAKGIDSIGCVSVNDAFVMGAWAKDQGTGDQILMLGDGSGELTKSIGMDLDLSARGLGVRSQRYAMVVDDGVVKSLVIEDDPGGMDVSSAENVLASL